MDAGPRKNDAVGERASVGSYQRMMQAPLLLSYRFFLGGEGSEGG